MAQNNQSAEQDLNQLLKVRHDKLKDLQEKKALAAAQTMPMPDKGTKSREAAL